MCRSSDDREPMLDREDDKLIRRLVEEIVDDIALRRVTSLRTPSIDCRCTIRGKSAAMRSDSRMASRTRRAPCGLCVAI